MANFIVDLSMIPKASTSFLEDVIKSGIQEVLKKEEWGLQGRTYYLDVSQMKPDEYMALKMNDKISEMIDFKMTEIIKEKKIL